MSSSCEEQLTESTNGFYDRPFSQEEELAEGNEVPLDCQRKEGGGRMYSLRGASEEAQNESDNDDQEPAIQEEMDRLEDLLEEAENDNDWLQAQLQNEETLRKNAEEALEKASTNHKKEKDLQDGQIRKLQEEVFCLKHLIKQTTERQELDRLKERPLIVNQMQAEIEHLKASLSAVTDLRQRVESEKGLTFNQMQAEINRLKTSLSAETNLRQKVEGEKGLIINQMQAEINNLKASLSAVTDLRQKVEGEKGLIFNQMKAEINHLKASLRTETDLRQKQEVDCANFIKQLQLDNELEVKRREQKLEKETKAKIDCLQECLSVETNLRHKVEEEKVLIVNQMQAEIEHLKASLSAETDLRQKVEGERSLIFNQMQAEIDRLKTSLSAETDLRQQVEGEKDLISNHIQLEKELVASKAKNREDELVAELEKVKQERDNDRKRFGINKNRMMQGQRKETSEMLSKIEKMTADHQAELVKQCETSKTLAVELERTKAELKQKETTYTAAIKKMKEEAMKAMELHNEEKECLTQHFEEKIRKTQNEFIVQDKVCEEYKQTEEALSKKYSESLEEKNRLLMEVSALKTKVNDYKKEKNDLLNKIRELRAEVENRGKQVKELTDEQGEKNEQLRICEDKMASLEKMIEEKQAENEALIEKVGKLEQDMETNRAEALKDVTTMNNIAFYYQAELERKSRKWYQKLLRR